jgi:hypothetical protein
MVFQRLGRLLCPWWFKCWVYPTLKRGGVAYGFAVEAVCYKGGHIFGDDKPYTILTFN